jgi:hypothetical protein
VNRDVVGCWLLDVSCWLLVAGCLKKKAVACWLAIVNCLLGIANSPLSIFHSLTLLNSEPNPEECDPRNAARAGARNDDSSTTAGNMSIFLAFLLKYQSDKLG